MMGNYHVRFLGGKGAVTPLTYPVCYLLERIASRDDQTLSGITRVCLRSHDK